MSISRHQAVGAYRRWEPPAFDERDVAQPAAPPTAATMAPESIPTPEETVAASLPEGFRLPTAEDIERIHEEARAAGYAEGYEAGRKEGEQAGQEAGRAAGHEAGYEAGHSEGKAQAEEERERLRALASSFDQSLAHFDEEVAEELLALAIEIARQLVGHTLATRPDAIAETIHTALLQLPQEHAHIYLSPEDITLVREQLGEQFGQAGHRLVEDDSLTRGGCRIESPGAQIDATVETRWRRVLEHLGQPNAAWEPKS